MLLDALFLCRNVSNSTPQATAQMLTFVILPAFLSLSFSYTAATPADAAGLSAQVRFCEVASPA